MASDRLHNDPRLAPQVWSLTLPRWATANRQPQLRQPARRPARGALRLLLRRSSLARGRSRSAAPTGPV